MGGGASDRWLGIACFLPVPLVLWLFTRRPWGTRLSVALGLAVMLTHPLYARRFALRRAVRRCLWCGGAAGGDPTQAISVIDPRGTTLYAACRQEHRRRIEGLLRWADRSRWFLRFGILGSVLVLLGGLLASSWKLTGSVTAEDFVAVFKTGVALTVLPIGLAAWRPRRRVTDADHTGEEESPRVGAGPVRSPFPVHIQALIGTAWVLWLFRVIGAVWAIQGIRHLLDLASR